MQTTLKTKRLNLLTVPNLETVICVFVRNGYYLKRLTDIANFLREKAQKGSLKKKIHYTELGVILGISPSHAAQLAKQLAALFDDFEYERGILKVHVFGEVRK